jgi:hypothetical protein
VAWPKAADLEGFNRLILTFYLTDGRGIFDVSWQRHQRVCAEHAARRALTLNQTAETWRKMPAMERRALLDEYHAAGIAVMVSAFGGTGEWASLKEIVKLD